MKKILNLSSFLVFTVCFILPVLSIASYLMLFSTDRYESVAATVISEQKSGASSFDFSLLGLPSFGSDRDAYIVREFILSRDMMGYLDRQIGIRKHYSDPKIDYFARLAPDATDEEFLELYQGYFEVEYDLETKILMISVQAFTAKYAQQAVQLVLRRADEFIDALNNKVSREQVRFFEAEIVKREKDLRDSKAKLLAFQQENKIFSTEAEAATIFTTISALETLMAQKTSELDSRRQILSRNSAKLQELEGQIASLRRQIASEKTRLAGGEGTDISKLQAEFLEFTLGLELATGAYKSTLATLEQIRVEASRKLKFLVVVTLPSLAGESEYPARAYIIISAILICLMINAVVSIIVAIIREHG